MRAIRDLESYLDVEVPLSDVEVDELAGAVATLLADAATHPDVESLSPNVSADIYAWLYDIVSGYPASAPRTARPGAMTLEDTVAGAIEWCAEWADLRDGASCTFCEAYAGNDYHLAGAMDAGANNVVCDPCWDERLR